MKDIKSKQLFNYSFNILPSYWRVIVELRANSSPHSVPGRARTQTQVLGPKTQFKLGLE